MGVERLFGTLLISLHGEFDRTCSRPFREELERLVDEHVTALILDVHELELIDSPGLRMLLALDGAAREYGLEFTVLCGSGAVRCVLRQTGLDGVLSVIDDRGAVPASDSPV